MLLSEAEVFVDEPALMAERMVARLREHDVGVETRGARTFAELGLGIGSFEPTADALLFRLEARDQGSLEMLREYVAASVSEFSPGARPVIRWRGHAAAGATFANFREVRLERAVAITPRLRRLTFSGDDLGLFAADELHVRMYFPPNGVAPEWPRPSADGRTIWPEEGRRPEMRYYTIRRVDPDRGWVEVDMVLHDDAGPGSAFAVDARPGAICGMAGPVGRAAAPAAWTLLAGDETALPAIARMLEGMPADARGLALIEVADGDDELPLAAPPGVELRWLRRNGAPAGTTTLLLDAIRAERGLDSDGVFAWVACEANAAKAIRGHLRAERRIPRERQLVVGYWEREHEHAHD